MNDSIPDHYSALGVGRRSSLDEVRMAFRLKARQVHPDLNPDDPEALRRSQELNAAYEVLSDLKLRREYDRERENAAAPGKQAFSARGRVERNVTQEVRLRPEEFIRGTTMEVTVRDPANPDSTETYTLEVPEDTAPKSRLRIPRTGAVAGGDVIVRLMLMPSARFKASGSDLRVDLRISASRATQGGTEMVPGPTGGMVRVSIPAGVARGAMIKVSGEGLPKPRGGRGDLIARIQYRPEVRITRR
jgi:DnaJ-class molecular chaperone